MHKAAMTVEINTSSTLVYVETGNCQQIISFQLCALKSP